MSNFCQFGQICIFFVFWTKWFHFGPECKVKMMCIVCICICINLFFKINDFIVAFWNISSLRPTQVFERLSFLDIGIYSLSIQSSFIQWRLLNKGGVNWQAITMHFSFRPKNGVIPTFCSLYYKWIWAKNKFSSVLDTSTKKLLESRACMYLSKISIICILWYGFLNDLDAQSDFDKNVVTKKLVK